jgi:hypothetical protein
MKGNNYFNLKQLLFESEKISKCEATTILQTTKFCNLETLIFVVLEWNTRSPDFILLLATSFDTN